MSWTIAGKMVQEKVFSISESGRASGSGVTVKWLSRLSLTLTHNAFKCVYSRLQRGNGCKRSICRRRKRTSINLKGPGILKNDRGVEGIAQALSVSLGSLPTNSALLLRPETAGLNFGWDWSSLLWNFINFIVQRQSWNSGVCRKVALVSTYYKSDDVEKITEDILGRRQIFLERRRSTDTLEVEGSSPLRTEKEASTNWNLGIQR